MSSTSLPYGTLGESTVHLCVDMQTLFADRTDWHVPWMERVLPVVAGIAEAHPGQTVFTRFVPPRDPRELPGSWQRYYRRWRQMTRETLDPDLIELVPPLRALVPPARVVDKQRFSPFAEGKLQRLLHESRVDSLVITGGETDVCVLAAVLDAVDLGYRVVIAADAVCSVSDRMHDSLLTMYRERFGQQIEVAPADTILAAWA